MGHTVVKYDYTQKNRSDAQTLLTSVGRRMGLELDRQQSQGQVRSPLGMQVLVLIEGGLILRHSEGSGWKHSI